jgi:hypothetical protein
MEPANPHDARGTLAELEARLRALERELAGATPPPPAPGTIDDIRAAIDALRATIDELLTLAERLRSELGPTPPQA